VVCRSAAGENEDEVVRASPVLRSASPRYARLGKRSAPVINDDQQPQQQQQQHRLSKRTVPTNFRFAGLGKRTVSLAYKAAGLGKRLDDVSDDWETEDPRLYAGPQNDPLFDDYAETGRPEEMEEKRRVSTAMRWNSEICNNLLPATLAHNLLLQYHQ